MKKTKLTSLAFMMVCLNVFSQTFYQTNKLKNSKSGYFTENVGQIVDQHSKPNASVLYNFSMSGLNVSLKKTGFSYDAWTKEKVGKIVNSGKKHQPKAYGLPDKFEYNFHRVDIEFIGANPNCEIKTSGISDAYLNYYTTAVGTDGKRANQFEKVTYYNLYPGIDLEFLAQPSASKPVEYNFIIHPGADMSLIKIKYTGANSANLIDGKIILNLNFGNLTEEIPASWILSTNEKVDIRYNVLQTTENSTTIGLIGNYNTQETLIVDPLPELSWATYFGGADDEQSFGLTSDANGNIYLSGTTNSTSSIATTGAHQTKVAGQSDAFLAKFNSAGVRQWATYYGGADYEQGFGCKIDVSGNIMFSGQTESTSGMATTGTHQTTFAGNYDAFLAKFNSSGVLQWGTYYGGADYEDCYQVEVDGNGNSYITGSTESSTGIASSGAYQTTFGGTYDAYLAKFNSNGVLQWATYFGSSDDDDGYGISLDKKGNIAIGGYTNSTSGIATSGAHQTSIGGSYDAFLAQFNGKGNLQWATYYGGKSDEDIFSCMTDSNNNICFIGSTESTSGIASSGAYQTTLGGASDAMCAVFNSSGARQWGSYFGGAGPEIGLGIYVNKANSIFITGYTQSDKGIATTGAYKTKYSDAEDVYLAKFSNKGTIQYATYYGDSLTDIGANVHVDNSNSIYVTGITESDKNISTKGAHQTAFGGTTDAFLLKFKDCAAPLNTTPVGNASICANTSTTLSASGNGKLKWYNAFTGGTLVFVGTTFVTPKINANTNYYVEDSSANCVSGRTSIAVTVKKNPSRNITVFACNSYTSPSKKYVKTKSELFGDTIPNKGGCDSVFIIDLTIGNTSYSTINPKTCSSYTSPSGKYTKTKSANFMDTIKNKSGCDSIITINLTIAAVNYFTIFPKTCGSYTSPSGKYTKTSSAIFNDTISKKVGCDSIFTINLTVNKKTTSSIAPVACNSYKSPSGKYTKTVSSVFIDTIINKGGCDSIITINLTIKKSSSATISPVVCGTSYTSPSGKYTKTVTSTFNDTIPNKQGCDSVITVKLTVVTLSPVIQRVNNDLQTTLPYNTYQWYKSGVLIPSATNRNYTPVSNDKYSVMVTDINKCSKTSLEYDVKYTNTKSFAEKTITISPNPTTGIINIKGIPENNVILVNTLLGQEIMRFVSKSVNQEIDLSQLKPGVYLITAVNVEGNATVIKLLKE